MIDNNKNKYKNNEFYRYIRNSQKPRKQFYLMNIIFVLIMLINESVFFYNSLQFSITGCSIVSNQNSIDYIHYLPIITNNQTAINNYNYYYKSSSGSGGNNNNFTLATCINNSIEFCIPIMYGLIPNQIESLSFRIPFILNKYTESILMVNDYLLILCVITFILIVFTIARTFRMLYIKRSRIQLLLTIQVLPIKPKLTLEEKLFLLLLITLSIIYSISKLVIINAFNSSVSYINCNNLIMELQFSGKTSNSIIQSISNFLLFLYLFKDPINEIYENITELYSDLLLSDLIKIGNNSLIDNLKSIKTIPLSVIKKAILIYINKTYPNENHTKKINRTKLFSSLSGNHNYDLLNAIEDFKITHPQNFKNLFNQDKNEEDDNVSTTNYSINSNNQIDNDDNNEIVNENSNLINKNK